MCIAWDIAVCEYSDGFLYCKTRRPVKPHKLTSEEKVPLDNHEQAAEVYRCKDMHKKGKKRNKRDEHRENEAST